MDEPAENPDVIRHETVKRPMNAFLIFCKRHRGLVHEKNPSLDNRSVTRILGDLWANLGQQEKYMYTDLAKQYKDAFLKANPDYKWYNPEKHAAQVVASGNKPGRPSAGSLAVSQSLVLASTGISPGKLADPSNMGGLSMLLMAGQQTLTSGQMSTTDPKMTSSQPPVTSGMTGLTITDQRTTELTSSRNNTSNWEFGSWSTMAPSIKRMDTETETKTSSGGAGKKFSKTEEMEYFPSGKNSIEWPVDMSKCSDTFQTSSIESRPALAEIDRSGGVLARRDPTTTDRSPERREPTSKVISDRAMNETARSTIANPSSGSDALSVTKTDVTGLSSWPLSRPLFGPAMTAPMETDRAKIPFVGHPLTYLFSQPTQTLSAHQRLKILLPTSPPVVSAMQSNSPPTTKGSGISEPSSNPESLVSAKLTGTADESSKRDGLARLSQSDLRKFVVEKVIEAAYSREQEDEPSMESFPKTKKQLAVDKLSSNKPNTPPHNRNGSEEPYGINNNNIGVSRSISAPSDGTEAFEMTERSHDGRRRSAAAIELNATEINGDVSAMTIAEINEKLIMKVVQEEDVTMTSVFNSPVSESRLPLKLQKRYKKLDGGSVHRHSGSSSASFGSSSPDRSSSSVLDLEASSGLSTSELQPHFPGSAEKSGFPAAGAQKVNILLNANLLAAYPEFPRSGSLLTGERRQLGSTGSGSSTGTVSPPKSSTVVDKLIETLIHESFALPTVPSTDSKLPGFPTPQHQTTTSIITPITSPGEDDRTRPDREFDSNATHPLRHVNKTLDGGVKALKRKRNKRTESSDHSLDLSAVTQSSQKSDVRDDANGHAERIGAQTDPTDSAMPSPKRLRESSTSDEACPDMSGAPVDLYKPAGGSDAVKISGAWHLLDNILNERAIDLNGGRAREEINNNNSREKATIGVDHEGLSASTNKALRKSKRANQGLRYKELMSKGVLYASRKSMDSNILIEDNRDNADAMNEDEGNDLCGIGDTTLPRRHFHADSTSLDLETEVGRRYKSGDFDLEAHIACLPACQIEVTDRKSAGKIKSRSHSQSAASSSVSFMRLPHQKRNDLKSDEMKNRNGVSLEVISFSKLRRLTRLSAACRKNLRRLKGSALRKARDYYIVQFLPLSSYHTVITQPVTRETNSDEHAVSSPMTCTPLTVISSSDYFSSFSHQVAAEREAFDAQKREMHSSFDILAAAAAVSSSGD